MHVLLRLPLPAAVLLLAGVSFAQAESPMPDPIAPAVIGRPLDQIKPARPVREKSAAPTAARPKQAATGSAKAARQPAAPAQTLGAAAAPDAPATQRPTKQAVDDRADPRMPVDDVGKGTQFARKRLAPGAYFGDRHRNAVRRYYAANPAPARAAQWEIGEPVPRGAPVSAVPKGLLASLPEVPPGHRYIQLGGEVVLIASESRMVVDGISRHAR